MVHNSLFATAKGKITQLREITREIIILPVEEQQGTLKQHPLCRQFARGMMLVGIVATLTGLATAVFAPLSIETSRRAEAIRALQIEHKIKPMPAAEFNRRFKEIIEK